jgi:hypothetical protein
MACSRRVSMVFPATLLAWVRAAPLKPIVRLLSAWNDLNQES